MAVVVDRRVPIKSNLRRVWNGHYNPFHCATCWRFLAKVRYALNGFEEVMWVRGMCAKHGEVEAAAGWCYEDLVGWPA